MAEDTAVGIEAPPPRANPLLVGHERAEAEILAAISAGRLAHAWLLTGPPGIGKATLAFRLARFLLQRRPVPPSHGDGAPPSLFVDPSDPVFRRVASGGHGDLLTIERRLDERTQRLRHEIVVDDVRTVTHFLSSTASEGGWRVVVVDGADWMNASSANALLKILEEPPQRSVLVLTAAAPSRLPATIRSRCRRLALAPLSGENLAALLKRYAPALRQDDIADLTQAAGGGIGTALMLAAHDGVALRGRLMRLLDQLPDLDLGEALRLGDAAAIADDGMRYRIVAEGIGDWLGGRVRATAGPVTSRAAAGSLERWVEVWEKSQRLLAQVDQSNLDRKQTLLTVLFGLRAAASP